MIKQNITETLEVNYMPYTAYVILDRALPEIDGFKPSQRRILYTMFKMGLLKGNRKKSQGVVGQTMFLHPHGDMAIYETLVRMSKDAESLLIPFIDSKGNFGKQYSRDMKYASARYCVTGDTLINTDEGLVFIKDIVKESELNSDNDINIKIQSLNNQKNIASKFFNSGMHDILKVVTKFGYEVKGTLNHPLLVLTTDNDGKPFYDWKMMADIKKGDFLVVNTNIETIESKNDLISKNEARFLGGMLSEGFISELKAKGNYYRVGFNNTNYEFVEDMKRYLQELAPESKIIETIKDGVNKPYKELYIHNKEFYSTMLNKYNYKHGAKNKFIPQVVLKSSKNIQKEFLKYLFEGDGGVSFRYDKKGKYYLKVCYSSYSRQMIQEIKIMLLQFGVTSSTIKDRSGWKLEIGGYTNVKNFKDNIGFAYKDKQEILDKAFQEIDNSKQQGGRNGIPYISEYIRNKYDDQWLKTNNFSNEIKFNMNKDKLKSLISKDDFELIQEMFESGYKFLPVTIIEECGKDIVYSIRVDSDCHSFTANGFINHNTEVRLTKIASELFTDINKDTVDMVDNYDNTMKEPRLLPVTFPSILTNPQTGIANGMASNFAPFNLNEVIDFTIAYIKNQKVSLTDYIKAPDFPTGGNIVYNKEKFDEILKTGRGSFDIRATYRIEKNSIIFEELPYTTTYEAVIDKITSLIKEGKIKDIIDIDDIYGRNSKGIEITVKSSANKELLVEKLFKMTPLQSSFGCNFNIVVNGRPKVLGVSDIIREWLAFRANAIKRGASYDIEKKTQKKHLLLALKQVLLDIDKAVKIIRETKKNDEVVKNLMKAFKIDEVQAEYVADIKLKYLNKEYLVQRITEIENLEKEIEGLEKIINDKKTLAKLIIEQLQNVKKAYGTERKSKIIEVEDIPTVTTEEINIDNYNVRIFVTKEGYLKKIPLTSLRGNNDIKVKDGDKIVGDFETKNNSDILVFTDKNNCYKYKSYELEDSKPSLLGEYLPSLLNLKNEEILFVTVTNDYKGFLIVGFEDGKVAKIDLSAYETKQNRSMLKNAYADKKAIYWNVINEDIDILTISSINKALVFSTSLINSKTSRNTIGVQIMKSKNDSFVKSYHDFINSNPINTEDLDYYKVFNTNSIGKYIKKGDVLNQ